VSLAVCFWGTRGSVPSPGPSTVRHGGNTPCVELRTATGARIILDAGTGIRALGQAMAAAGESPRDIEIYLSHLHWDHVQGLPFFAPLYQAGYRVTVRAAEPLEAERVLRGQMSPHVFPIPFGEMPATVKFCSADGAERRGDGYGVRALPVRHPGGALALRFSDRPGLAGGIVYIPDNELDPATQYAAPSGWRDELVAFVRGARLLVHDAMYTPAEREQRRGWGHSIYTDVVAMALDAGVETLALFHHDPERSDDDVEAILGACRRLAAADGRPLTVIAAAEGLRLTV
jgi:phosphoribosyl 1,2-cyclic phosphodiesterase